MSIKITGQVTFSTTFLETLPRDNNEIIFLEFRFNSTGIYLSNGDRNGRR